MDGKSQFSVLEADQIRVLLRTKTRAGSTQQKTIRSQLRKLGFFISDFALEWSAFKKSDFDQLVEEGTIKIIK